MRTDPCVHTAAIHPFGGARRSVRAFILLLVLTSAGLAAAGETESEPYTTGASDLLHRDNTTAVPKLGSANKAATSLADQAFAPTEWTTGNKRLLVIRFRYPDQPAVDPISAAELDAGWQQNLLQVPAYSHEMLQFQAQLVLTPTVTLPQPTAYYANKPWSEELLTHARAAAAGSGPNYNALYDSKFYSLDVVIDNVAGVPASGAAVLGAKGSYFTGGAGVIQCLAHELGHNLGLSHVSRANHGEATFGPLKPGPTLIEYGDLHDLMGTCNVPPGEAPKYHFQPLQKKLLGWLGEDRFHRALSSGTYRIYAHDQPGLVAGQKVGLRVPHSGQEDVWYSFRQLFLDNPWSMNGAEMHIWNPYMHTYGGANEANTIRLDPRPATPQGIDDAALVIGRSFHDAYWDVYVTPIAKGGTQPESLDLVVNFGPFAGNAAPTAQLVASSLNVAVDATVNLTVTADDPDADPLAYSWEFGDASFSTNNSAIVSKSWSSPGRYRVLATVSDMKGEVTRKAVTVTVGAPNVGSISGQVLDSNGAGLAGVHIHNGLNSPGNAGFRSTYTLDDGSFVLSNLAAGTYTLNAGQEQSVFAFDGGWTNPVQVNAGQDAAARNFRRSGGPTSITGRVLAGPSGSVVPGVLVQITQSDGVIAEVFTNASGVWQRNVPQGITLISAIAPAGSGWTVGELYPAPGGAFPNPWLINVGGNAIDRLHFYFRTPALPVVGFQSATSSIAEGAGEALIPISVQRSAGTRLNMTVKMGTGGSNNGFGVDHLASGVAFSFPAIDPANPPGNQIEQTYLLRVPIIDDTLADGGETLVFYLVIGQVTYAGSNLLHTLTIIDDDSPSPIFANGFE